MAMLEALQELERLRSEMDRVFGDLSTFHRWPLGFLPGTSARRYPRVNVAEAGDAYRVVALAPGVDPSTLEITVKGNTLTLAGEKKAPEGVNAEAYHRSERAVGRFHRTVELPADVDPDKVRATYRDGILRVELEKAEAAKPRKIAIEMG
ncbi:MAG: Hsp20/alpha crystallin family protein [Deferrisomatales bacterium]